MSKLYLSALENPPHASNRPPETTHIVAMKPQIVALRLHHFTDESNNALLQVTGS